MTKNDIEREGSCNEAGAVASAAWTKPALVRLRAGDAELGTRPNVADGAFSVS